MRRSLAVCAVMLIPLAAAPSASAQAPTVPDSISATATARVDVERPARLSDRTILAAVERARRGLAPEALRLVRREAVALGYAAGVRVGRLIALADSPLGPFGPFDYQAQGTFGPGRFCGTVARFRTRVVNGRRIRERIGSRRTCRVPRQVSRTVTATYAIDGPLGT